MSAPTSQPPAIPQSVLYRQALAELEAEFPAASASMLTLLCEAAHLTVRLKLLDFAEEDLFDTDPLNGSHFQSKTPTPLLRLYKERDRITARYQAIVRQLTALSRRAAASPPALREEPGQEQAEPCPAATGRIHPDAPPSPPALTFDPRHDKLNPDNPPAVAPPPRDRPLHLPPGSTCPPPPRSHHELSHEG